MSKNQVWEIKNQDWMTLNCVTDEICISCDICESSGYLDFFKYLCSMGMPDIFVKSSFFLNLEQV